MATIKQVLAAISQDGTLGPNQKRFVTEAIQRAETWCQLQAGPKPRKITNAKALATLDEWETARGKELHYTDLQEWIAKQRLSEFQVRLMIEEFRAEMTAKGKQYANFKAAFQTYLTKGYLSKTLTACLAENNKSASGTTIHNRGVSL